MTGGASSRHMGNAGTIKAVVCDLDNTVLRRDKSMSERTRDALRRCRERGIRVLAASARPERTVREFGVFEQFEALVTLNGARVILPGRVVTRGIRRETGERIVQRLLTLPGAVVSVEMSGGIFASEPVPEWNATVFDGFPALPEGELYKILVSGAAESAVRGAVTEDTYCTAIEGGKLWQIMGREATKWGGVREMLDEFGIEPSQCAFFGDDWDDIQCVKNCGLGVAMGNAIDEVKSAADALAGDCNEDGAAEFIEKEILC